MEKLADYERAHLDRLRRLAPGCTVLLRSKGDLSRSFSRPDRTQHKISRHASRLLIRYRQTRRG